MSASATVDEFLDSVRKSGLLSADQIDSAVRSLQQEFDGALDSRHVALALMRDGLLTNFQARQLLRGRSRHFVLGDYRILEPLRPGDSSQVFLAEDVGTRRRVTIEILSNEGQNLDWRVHDGSPTPVTVASPTPPPNELKFDAQAASVKPARPRPKLMTGSPTPIPRQVITVTAPNPAPRRAPRWPLAAAIVLLIASVWLAATW